MLYIEAGAYADDEPAALHLKEDEDITIVLPDMTEVYVSGSGEVSDSQGRILKVS